MNKQPTTKLNPYDRVTTMLLIVVSQSPVINLKLVRDCRNYLKMGCLFIIRQFSNYNVFLKTKRTLGYITRQQVRHKNIKALKPFFGMADTPSFILLTASLIHGT